MDYHKVITISPFWSVLKYSIQYDDNRGWGLQLGMLRWRINRRLKGSYLCLDNCLERTTFLYVYLYTMQAHKTLPTLLLNVFRALNKTKAVSNCILNTYLEPIKHTVQELSYVPLCFLHQKCIKHNYLFIVLHFTFFWYIFNMFVCPFSTALSRNVLPLWNYIKVVQIIWY